MMFTIHFRGVAVFASKGDKVTEVIFPNAETVDSPPEGRREKVKDANGNVITEVMFHADGTPAPRHFAGALIIGRNQVSTYRKLLHRRIEIGTGSGAQIKGALKKEIPPLYDVITHPDYKLSLPNEPGRRDPKRVATRIMLYTGDIHAEQQSNANWVINGGNAGGITTPERYFAGARLMIDSADPTLRIQVKTLEGVTIPDEAIELNQDQREMYLYNFDAGVPSEGDLTNPEQHDPDYNVDHDFKWVYQVLDRVAKPTWKDWLGGGAFPCPVRIPTGGFSMMLIPVSTCYETVWPDE
jgi:hypothetical protein